MASHPVVPPRRNPTAAADNDGEALVPQLGAKGCFSFRYSATEIVSSGDRARVRTRHARFEDGRLTTEAFDGEVDGSVLESLQADARRLFEAQLALWWKSFALLLPPAWRGPDKDR